MSQRRSEPSTYQRACCQSPGNTPGELDELLRSIPGIDALTQAQPGEPELPRVFYASMRAKRGTYPMVHIPLYGRLGTLWVGRLPGSSDEQSVEEEILALLEFGISRIVCLVPSAQIKQFPRCAQYESRAMQQWTDGFRTLPVDDFKTPLRDTPFETELADTDRALATGNQTLIHCVAGCGRTGMFVSCLLVRAGESPTNAIRKFRMLRGCGPETPEQVAYVFRYARRLEQGLAIG